LGVQPIASDFTPGDLIFKVTNNTGSQVESAVLSFKLYIYNDEDRSSKYIFSSSLDNVDYFHNPDLDYVTPEAMDASPGWVLVERSLSFDESIPNGTSLYLKCTGNDEGGADSRDEFAIDDFSIIFSSTPLNVDQLTDVTIDVTPNPYCEQFCIESDENIQFVHIYNSAGDCVKKVMNPVSGHPIQAGDLPEGIYMVKITLSDGTTQTHKIMKK